MAPGSVNQLPIDYPDLVDTGSGSDDAISSPKSANGATLEASSSKSSGEVILAPSPLLLEEPTNRPSILVDSSDSEDDLLDS